MIEKIKEKIQKYKQYQERIWASSLKPVGLVGLVIGIGCIFILILSKLQTNLLFLLYSISMVILILFTNFDILIRNFNKKGDEIDKAIASNVLSVIIFFIFVLLLSMFLMVFKINW